MFTSNKSTDTTPSLWKNVKISETYTPVEVSDTREDGQKTGECSTSTEEHEFVKHPDAAIVLTEAEIDRLSSDMFRRKFETFLQEFCPALRTDDVINDDSFATSIYSNCQTVIEYKKLYSSYLSSKNQQNKTTDLYKSNDEICGILKEMIAEMEKAAQIVICPKMGLNSIMLSIKSYKEIIAPFPRRSYSQLNAPMNRLLT